MVDDALGRWSNRVTGGEVATDSHLAGGNFYKATLIDGASPGCRSRARRSSGRSWWCCPSTMTTEAVAIANGDRLWPCRVSLDSRALAAHRFAKRIRAGQVYVNTYGVGGGAELPFGGFGKSGFGREKGFEGLDPTADEEHLREALMRVRRFVRGLTVSE